MDLNYSFFFGGGGGRGGGIFTWVKNVYSDSSSLEFVGQFFGVQYVGKLGLAIGGVEVVALLPVQIFPVHPALDVSHAGYDYDSEIKR